MTTALATTPARKPSVMSPVNGQLSDPEPHDHETHGDRRLAAGPAPGQVFERRPQLRATRRQLVDQQRQVGRGEDQR